MMFDTVAERALYAYVVIFAFLCGLLFGRARRCVGCGAHDCDAQCDECAMGDDL